MYNYGRIENYLQTNFLGRTFIQFEELDSTNNKAKSICSECPEGTVIIAKEQTSGKGKKNRDWHSPYDEGLYLSIILKDEDDKNMEDIITLISCASICRVLKENYFIEIKYSWPNDILYKNMKIAGVLSEKLSKNNQKNIIAGIGININNEPQNYPGELKKVALSLKSITEKEVDKEKFIGQLLNEFEKNFLEYKTANSLSGTVKIILEFSDYIGNTIIVRKTSNKKMIKCIGKNFSENAELIAEDTEGRQIIINHKTYEVIEE